jgi:hypothetical protein
MHGQNSFLGLRESGHQKMGQAMHFSIHALSLSHHPSPQARTPKLSTQELILNQASRGMRGSKHTIAFCKITVKDHFPLRVGLQIKTPKHTRERLMRKTKKMQ